MPKLGMTFGKCLKINESRTLNCNDFGRMFEAALNKVAHKKCKIVNVVLSI